MKPQNVVSKPGEAEIISQLHDFFQRYGATFVDLAVGNRSDVDALLEFYGAPLRFVGSTFHMVMKDDAAITGADGMGGEIDRLRRASIRSGCSFQSIVAPDR